MPRGSRPGEHRGGRKPGTRNQRTIDGETYARTIVEDEAGCQRLIADFRRGKLPPQLLLHLWQLAYGTPKELTSNAIAVVNGQSPGTPPTPDPTRYTTDDAD